MKQSDKLKELLEEIHKLAEESILYLPIMESLDHEEKEPLIDDSEVCKIVRDWYEYHATDMPIYCEDGCTLSICHTARIEFLHKIFRNLKQNYGYGITELCGEEEDA